MKCIVPQHLIIFDIIESDRMHTNEEEEEKKNKEKDDFAFFAVKVARETI